MTRSDLPPDHPLYAPDVPARLTVEVAQRVGHVLGLHVPSTNPAGPALMFMQDRLGGVYMQSICLDELVDMVLTALVHPSHLYWSTACQHGNHEHCAASVSTLTGQGKKPHTCKFCPAECFCPDHVPADPGDPFSFGAHPNTNQDDRVAEA